MLCFFARILVPASLAAVLVVSPAAAQAPLATHDLARGEVLKAGDFSYPPDVRPDSATSPIGWVTRRVVSAGEPLVAPTITRPDVIRAGQAVQMVWENGPIKVRLVGRAMGAAAIGESVLVRIDTKRRFEGIVVGPSLVRMASPDRSR